MPVGAERDPIVRWELGRLAALDLLEDGEVVCELESAWKRLGWGRGNLGALVLTDRRLLFLFTRFITRRTQVDSIVLQTISAVDVIESPRWGDKRGAIALTRSDHPEQLQLERIPGGRNRAEELRSSILRQRDLLQREVHA